MSSFPWLAFCALCAEEQYEIEEGIWKALLILLKGDPKITVDAALKVCFYLVCVFVDLFISIC